MTKSAIDKMEKWVLSRDVNIDKSIQDFVKAALVEIRRLQAEEANIPAPKDRCAELVRVLKYLDSCGGLGYEKHEMINKALSEFSKEAGKEGR